MTAPAISTAQPSRPTLLERALAIRIPITVELAIVVVIIAVAVALRFWDLGARALHHDESIHAKFTWDLTRGDYAHNPIYHGPLYYHVQGLLFFLFGASDYTARMSAALFGSILVGLPLFLRSRLGPLGTISAIAFLAFSPTIVYYSRFFREDIYMAMFTMLAAVAIWRYLDSGRDRWIIVFALAVTGSFATKEATYLSVAIMLVFLNVYLSADLARQTLEDRGTNVTWRRTLLTASLAPYAWAIAALWPFIGRFKNAAAWSNLPRPGDLLIVLGTLTVPLLLPFTKSALERIGLASAGELDMPGVCSAAASGNSQLVLGGIFAIAVGAVAFIGLQWRPKTWAIAMGASAFLYLTLMTSLWTNFAGMCTGPWGSLDYWLSQQDVWRGDQPWFYYYMLMPAYEFLPLVIALGGMWWATVRGNAFSRFLAFWMVATWLALSWAGEKMPWLNTHIALPTAVLAAWTVQRAWNALGNRRPAIDATLLLRFAAVAAVSMGAMLVIAYLPGGNAYALVRLVAAVVAIGAVVAAVSPYGGRVQAIALVLIAVGGLSFFTVRTTILTSFERGDIPEDPLIYTQSSHVLPKIASDIDRLAAATGKGYNLRIAVDGESSMAWPWAWYLRDYRSVNYGSMTGNPVDPAGYDVILVTESNIGAFQDALADSQVADRFAPPERHPFRIHFGEVYKQAMAQPGMGSCLASQGDCGPFEPWLSFSHLHLGPPNLDTWGRLWDGITEEGWAGTWLRFIRDHHRDAGGEWDFCRGCGSVNAYVYFPANFDRETGLITAQPIQPPEPGVDDGGRPVFGGLGSLPGQFFSPVDVEADADGNLYVIDRASKRLQKFDAEGNFIAGVDVRDDPSGQLEQSEPWGLAVAPDGRIVVADTFGWRIRVYTSDLELTGVTFGNAHAGDDPGPFDLFGPRDAVVDDAGQIWVTDTGHDRIVVYTSEGEFVRSIGESGAGEGQFDEPVGLARAEDGTIYVADMYNRRVVLLTPDGEFAGQFQVPGWGGQDVSDKPYIAALSGDRVAVSLPLAAEVRVYSRSGELLHSIQPTDDRLNQPYGLAETADGKLWIVEGGSARVRQFETP